MYTRTKGLSKKGKTYGPRKYWTSGSLVIPLPRRPNFDLNPKQIVLLFFVITNPNWKENLIKIQIISKKYFLPPLMRCKQAKERQSRFQSCFRLIFRNFLKNWRLFFVFIISLRKLKFILMRKKFDLWK